DGAGRPGVGRPARPVWLGGLRPSGGHPRAAGAGAPPAAGQGGAERAREYRTLRAGVWVLVALTAAAYSVFALERYYAFRDGSYDLVIFDQAVRSYAHFQPGISIIKGVHNGFGPQF